MSKKIMQTSPRASVYIAISTYDSFIKDLQVFFFNSPIKTKLMIGYMQFVYLKLAIVVEDSK